MVFPSNIESFFEVAIEDWFTTYCMRARFLAGKPRTENRGRHDESSEGGMRYSKAMYN